MKPTFNENNTFFFDQNLNNHLFNELNDKLRSDTKVFLFKNINNSVDYQHRFLKKVQEKLGDAVTDITTYVRPDCFIEKNMEFNKRHTKADGLPYIKVELVARYNKQNPGEIQFGLVVGPWFISFNSSGLVSCEKNWGWQSEVLFSQTLQVLKDNAAISRLITNLTKYVTSCNGCMDYSKEHFNDAHFIKYWAEYYGVWEQVSELAKQYLNQYCKNQTLPNIIRVSYDLAHIIPDLDALCKKHGVEKEQLSNQQPITLRANDTQQFDTLFCDLIQIRPYISNLIELRMALQLAQWMVIKQYGSSGITITQYNATIPRVAYNWVGYEACLKALSEQYGSVEVLVNDMSSEQPVVQKPVIEQTPVVRSGVVLPIQKLLASAEKKEADDYVELKFYDAAELKKTQQELLNIGMGNGRASNEPRKINYEQENEKDVFIMKLSKVEFEAIMERYDPQDSAPASISLASIDALSTFNASKKPTFASNSSSTETKINQLANSVSEKQAIINGGLGPRLISGWALHDVSDEGNCFYEAAAHQLEMIRHDVLQTNLFNTPNHAFLRLLIQGVANFHDKEWAGDAEIAILSKKLNLVVAVIDTRYPQRGYVYYYTDENGKERIALADLNLPNQPMIKLAYTGNHFLSVKKESVNKKVMQQTHVNNLFEMPKVLALPNDCTQLTIGDLHANMMLLLYFLVRYDVIEISAQNYQELAEIYKKGAELSKENFEKFNSIIDSLGIKNKQILIRLIGDEVADRGQNDYFIFKLLAKLQQEGINMEIIVSNHGGEFLMLNEKKDFSAYLSILPFQSCSTKHLQALLDKLIIKPEQLDAMIKTAYLPNLKLISYSLDSEQAISIYTHAPANLNELKNKECMDNSIYNLAVFFNVEYDISSIAALIKTIDGINEQFRLRLQNGEAFGLFEEGKPVYNFIWARMAGKQQEVLPYGYTASYIHGHTVTKNDLPNVYNLDGALGKILDNTRGTLKILVSSGSPAMHLKHIHKEDTASTNAFVNKASPLETETKTIKVEVHIQKLQEEVSQMISDLELISLEGVRAKKILAGIIEHVGDEAPEMLHAKVEKLLLHVNSLQMHKQWIKTLEDMNENKVISHEQYEQLKEMPFFRTDLTLLNYKNISPAGSLQNCSNGSMFFKQHHGDKFNNHIQKPEEAISLYPSKV